MDEHDKEVVSQRRDGRGVGVPAAVFDVDARGCTAACDVGVAIYWNASLRNDEVDLASLLKSNKGFPEFEVLVLRHTPDAIADRQYAQAPQQPLDEAIAWLGQQYGVV